MKHIIFATQASMPNFNWLYTEKVNRLIESGQTDILWLECDKEIGHCIHNITQNKLYCSLCRKINKQERRRIKDGTITYKKLSDYITDEIKQTVVSVSLEYNSAKELRSLMYKNVHIGLSIMSTYISITRNLNPKITSYSKAFFDSILRTEILVSELFLEIAKRESPETVYFINGRAITARPFVDLAPILNINFVSLENTAPVNINKLYLDQYFDCLPHSIENKREEIERSWNSNNEIKGRECIARSFFENRRNAVAAGDKIYISHQTKGLMPDGWDTTKENIVIFNSSEDEFYSIGGEWDENMLFERQLDGIKKIVYHYKNDSTKHFYVKVHPNLIPIRYKYHTELYHLKYDNLTVIRADSSINTYEIMDNASKVIVFGSTMGIEAAYANKVVIQLRPSMYNFTNSVYIPRSLEELWGLLDTPMLESKNNDEVLKFGYFIMQPIRGEAPRFIDTTYSDVSFSSFKIRHYHYQRILGSSVLYTMIVLIMKKITTVMKRVVQKWQIIPVDEA